MAGLFVVDAQKINRIWLKTRVQTLTCGIGVSASLPHTFSISHRAPSDPTATESTAMKSTTRALLGAAITTAAMFATQAAHAADYEADFVLTSNGQTFASFDFSTNNIFSGGFETITSLTGTVNGLSIIALLNPGNTGGNDNKFSPTGNHLNFNGFSFRTQDGSTFDNWNLYYSNADSTYKLFAASKANVKYWGDFNVTAVPEPETYAMLLAGLGVIGAMSRRKKAQAAAAHA